MKTGVAKAIARTIIWSLVLAGVSCLVVFAIYGGLNPNPIYVAYVLAASTLFISGLIAFTIYRELPIKRLHPIVGMVLTIIAWSIALALYGGIGIIPFAGWIGTCATTYGCDSLEQVLEGGAIFIIYGSVPISFVTGLITFTAYELSKKVRFVRKKQGKGYRLARL